MVKLLVSLLNNGLLLLNWIVRFRDKRSLEGKREEIRSDSSSEWAASFGVRRKDSEDRPSSKTDS